MTDNGGEQPGRRSSGGDADSWFKPSENRFRTQSEYQDPMEDREESEDEASEETAAVFPDSGGYAGLSASRPALVEPYPDALGVPPTPVTPPAPPTPAADPQGPLGLSYPGASEDAYRPISRIPGSEPSSWEKPAQAPPVAPEWGASHQAAPAWEKPEEPRETAEPLWDRRAEPEPEQRSEPVSASVPETGLGWESDGPSSREPETSEDASASTGGYPGIAASAQVPLPPEGSEGTDSVPAHDSWTNRGHDSWAAEPPDQEVPRTPKSDSWTDPQAWDAGSVPTGGGFDAKDSEPWAEPDGTRWTDPSPSYLDDRYDDELSPRSREWSTESPDELSAPSPVSSAQPSPLSDRPMEDGTLGGESGNTWAFDRNDPRLPEVVRDAELRRRESTSPEAERDSGPDTGELSAAVATSDDPLAAIANMQSRAKAKETEEREETFHSGSDPLRSDRPHAPEEPSWSRGADGATQMFDASTFRDRTAGYGGEEYAAAPRDELGYDGRGLDDYGHDGRHADERDPEFRDRADQGYDEPAYDERDYDDPVRTGQGYGERGYVGQGHAGQDYDEPGYADQGYEEPGHGDRGLEPEDHDDRSAAGAVAAGLPSDLGSEPTYGRHERRPSQAWSEDLRDSEEVGPAEDTDESEYDDGFTPADYGMSEGPRPVKRRRDRISEDFPGFDDRPLGGEAGDAYPGYDSIDFLADTEPGAVRTLWLGVASLIPLLGVITALVALFVTGPKAKKAIRESRGTLDGLGLITTGTVFAVIGIVVTVISIAVWLVL